MMRWTILSIVLVFVVAGCDRTTSEAVGCDVPLPPAGSNEVLRTKVRIADNLEVIVANVYIPPGVQVPKHYHPGEEFLFVIQGSAIQVEEGKPDKELKQGEAYVIPPQAVHEPYGGPEGGHAVVFRLHIDGMEERYPVE